MIVPVCFHGEADRKVIESLGGKIIDELENIPEVLMVEIPDDDDELLNKILEHSDVKHVTKVSDGRIPTGHIGNRAELTAISNSVPPYIQNHEEAYQHMLLKMKDYWDRGLTGKGLKFGIIDASGTNHAYLPTTNGIKFDSNIPSYNYAMDSHGTECAYLGIGKPLYVALPDGTGDIIRLSGIAPDAEFYAAAAGLMSDTTHTQINYSIMAVNWFISLGVDVISCSWGLTDYADASWEAASTAAYNAGIPIFVAIGNDGDLTIRDINRFPANSFGCYGVAGIDRTYRRETYSSTSNDVWFSACSASVTTATQGSTSPTTVSIEIDTLFNGTSAAAPQIAALYLLYKQALPNKKPVEIISIMGNSCMQLGGYSKGTRNLEYGYGLPQPSPEILRLPITVNSGLKLEQHTTMVQTPINTVINSLANNFTAEITFSFEASGAGAWAIRKFDTANNTTIWGLSLGVNNAMYYSWDSSGSNYNYSVSNNYSGFVKKTPQTWHLVYSFPNLYLYREGVQVGNWTAIGGTTFSTGNINNSSIQFCSGIVGIFKKARLYNRILSDSEITSIARNGMRVKDGLLLEYMAKGNEVSTILDSSGNGYHGTIQGVGLTPTVKRIR
jgi:hypothetical protein